MLKDERTASQGWPQAAEGGNSRPQGSSGWTQVHTGVRTTQFLSFWGHVPLELISF